MKEFVLTEHGAMPLVETRLAAQSLRRDFFGEVFAFLIPMLAFIEVSLVGRLFLSEILLLGVLPFLLMERGRLLLAPLPKKLIFLGLVWLLAQIVTDVIRDTSFEDWSRGWAKIVFLLLNFSAIYLFLNGKEKRFFLFAAGIAAGQLLIFFFNPSVFAQSYPWKFGYGMAITSFVVLVVQTRIFKGGRFWPAGIILAVGVFNLYMDFRSLGLICLLTAGFVLIRAPNRMGGNKIKLRDIAMLIFFGGIAIYGIGALYDYGAGDGWFGKEVQGKYMLQSSGDMGILLGGRAEILASSQAVLDSPIIGHGSWAKSQKYIDILEDALIQHGYEPGWSGGSDLIPSHSYLMGAWVDAGLGGAVFWLWVFVLAVRALVVVHGTNSVLVPLMAFVTFNLLWNILFSPLGADGRLHAAYDLSLLIFIMSSSKSLMEMKSRT